MSYSEYERFVTLEDDKIRDKVVRLYARITPGEVKCGFFSEDRYIWYRDILICDSATEFTLLRGKFLTETGDAQYESLCSKCQAAATAPASMWSLWTYLFPPPPLIDTKANDFAARMCKDFFVCLQYMLKTYGAELMHFAHLSVRCHHPVNEPKMTYSEVIEFAVLKFVVGHSDITYCVPFNEKKGWKTK